MGGASVSAASGLQRPRRRPGENRAGLLAAGTVEFGVLGYAAAQTGAIARRAGVSQPNVYANFASKRELFLACVRELHAAVQSSLASDAGSAVEAAAVDSISEAGTSQNAPRGAQSRLSTIDVHLTDEHSLLLYQAIAVLGDTQIALELRPIVNDLRTILGVSAYERAILRAAELLTELG